MQEGRAAPRAGDSRLGRRGRPRPAGEVYIPIVQQHSLWDIYVDSFPVRYQVKQAKICGLISLFGEVLEISCRRATSIMLTK